MYTTSNLADFGEIERKSLIELLIALDKHGLPNDFHDDNITPMLNKNSGYVFLTNDEYQVAMLNGDKIETWYSCINCGHEGFEETCKINDEGCNECIVNSIKNYDI